MEERDIHLNFPEALLNRHSGENCTYKGQEAGAGHVGGTQLRKPTVWELLCDLGQVTECPLMMYELNVLTSKM